MTVEEAIAATRAKWNHSPVDLRDVEERVAVRAVDAEVLVHAPQPHCPAVRIFVRHPKGWRSRYLHRVEDVDAVLDWCTRAGTP